MAPEKEKRFEEVAEKAAEKAEQIECSLAEYRDGLRVIVAALTHRLDQVNEELGG